MTFSYSDAMVNIKRNSFLLSFRYFRAKSLRYSSESSCLLWIGYGNGFHRGLRAGQDAGIPHPIEFRAVQICAEPKCVRAKEQFSPVRVRDGADPTRIVAIVGVLSAQKNTVG